MKSLATDTMYIFFIQTTNVTFGPFGKLGSEYIFLLTEASLRPLAFMF